jgi:riboflavin kinase/FMN adenylyltransferase
VAASVLTWLDQAQRRSRHVAIGEFDGVHRGHRALLEGVDTVLTFDPHPLAVVAPGRAPKLLTRLDRRARLLAELGVREVVVVPFGPRFAAKRARDFIAEDLVGRLGAESVCVGRNFRFGRGARADAGVLETHPGIRARVVEMVTAGGEVVSSTRVRALIAEGAIEEANALLERPFELPVRVSDGAGPLCVVGFDAGLVRPGAGRYSCQVAMSDGGWTDAEIEVPDGDEAAGGVGCGGGDDEVTVRFLGRA